MLGNKAIYVTGAARGIGFGIAQAVIEAGGRVAIGDLESESVAAAADQLVNEFDADQSQVLATTIDVTDPVSVEAALGHANSTFGRLDGLVNNAGVIRLGAELDSAPDDWRFQMEVNVVGTRNCCAVFAGLENTGDDLRAIVNVASNAGKVGYPNMAGYNASKAAVISLTRTLSSELADRKINVNAVCPGGVATPMLLEVAESVGARIGTNPDELYATMVPTQMGRHIEPSEIGRVVAFLLSDDAIVIRGQSINTDGGDTPY